MAEARPRVWVSQPLFADIVERLTEHFELDAAATVTAWTPAQVAERLRGASGALVTLNERIGPTEIAGAAALRAVANVGVGYDNLDVAALQARGIVATNTPDVLTETTADHAFALLLAIARRIPEADVFMRAGQYQRFELFPPLLGLDVYGKTLGIVGMGRIGTAVARRGALGFGMKVLYTANSAKTAVEHELGAARVTFAELLRRSDFVSIIRLATNTIAAPSITA